MSEITNQLLSQIDKFNLRQEKTEAILKKKAKGAKSHTSIPKTPSISKTKYFENISEIL